MTPDEEDRLRRAEEIQRYTKNRCEVLERENARLSKILERAFGDLCSECNCPNWTNINWENYRAELEERVENDK